MSIRAKLLIVLLACGVAPLLAGCGFLYFAGLRAAEGVLRGEVERDAERAARGIERTLRESESELIELARLRPLRDYVHAASEGVTVYSSTGGGEGSDRQAGRTSAGEVGGADATRSLPLPRDVWAEVNSFYRGRRARYAALTCLGADRRPLFRVERLREGAGGDAEADIQTQDFVAGAARADERVWTTRAPDKALRAPVTREAFGAALRVTVPIFLEEGAGAPRGALVAEVKLDSLFEEVGGASDEAGAREGVAGLERGRAGPSRLIVAVDESGQVVHHTLDALRYQPVAAAMPSFRKVAAKMSAGESGAEFFEEADSGERWLAAYRPVPGVGLSVAAAANYDEAVSGLRRAGLLALALFLPVAFALVALPLVFVRRTLRGVESVAANMAAVAAGGDLGRRLEEDHAGGETRALAENFNRMTERLRRHVEREAESRQFESFMRLSSMLTHDLKNAITGLSMLVANMERQYHREEFREDAIYSLREATDKLRRIVVRLSEPLKSLSGEYRSDARRIDLVPIIRRVLAEHVEPSALLYEQDVHLPESLFAHAEPGRVENVVENLVVNAVEAMGARGGRLTVEAGEDAPGYVFFSVADTGVGMGEEFIRTRLFRPFATTKEKGVGLGLYTCREVIEAHGGRLDVESGQGSGTRFRVVLPSEPFRLRERMQQRPPSSPPPPSHAALDGSDNT